MEYEKQIGLILKALSNALNLNLANQFLAFEWLHICKHSRPRRDRAEGSYTIIKEHKHTSQTQCQ